jgi:hypothetical protein
MFAEGHEYSWNIKNQENLEVLIDNKIISPSWTTICIEVQIHTSRLR